MINQDVLVQLLQDSLDNGQQPHLNIISASMTPLLRVGDQVVLASAETLTDGDILVLRSPEALYTHRLVTTLHIERETRLITRGDRTLCYDPLWEPATVVGRITARQRGSKILSFDQGAGQWLNRHFAQLARWEATLFDDHAVSWSRFTQPLQIGAQWREGWRRPIYRFIRLKFHLWRNLLLLFIR